MKDEDKVAIAKAMALPISKPRYYALQFKLLMYSWGKEVEISEEEWKKAEELGWVEKK
jgi:hypothetical protein